jgi:hypothetical protein
VKRRHALAFGTAILAGVACARAAVNAVDAAALGHMEAVLATCTAAAPQKASQYLLRIKATLGGATKDQVAAARKSEDYRQQYKAVKDGVSNLSGDGVADACAGYLDDGR